MKKITLFFTAFIFSVNVFGQVMFQKTYGGTDYDEGRCVRQTSDGGFIITGYTNSFGAGNYDVYLIRTDSNGWSLWTKTFGGANDDYAYSVQQTSDGGYVIGGSTRSFGAGNSDVYLIRTDSLGDTLWTKTFGGANDDVGMSVQQTTDGGYAIGGSTRSFGAGNSDVFLIRTDAAGDTLWTKTFGGTNDDDGYSAQQTSDGGYVIAGRTNSLGAGGYDVYLLKTDAGGSILWTKTFGGTNDDVGYSVQQTSDTGYVIAGGTLSYGSGNNDVYLIKTDAGGDSLWTKTFGGTDYDVGRSVQQTSDGGYVIAGYTRSFGLGAEDVYMIKTDVGGNTLWIKTYGQYYYDSGFSIQQTIDGGYIIVGGGDSYTGVDMHNVYLLRTNSAGDTLWVRSFGGTISEGGYAALQTIDGGYIIAGSTNSFGAGNNDVYLLKTDVWGNLLWTKTFGGIYNDGVGSLQQTSDGGYVLLGSTRSFGFSFGAGYLLKTDGSGNLLWSKAIGGSIIYSNYVQQTSDGGYIITGESSSPNPGSYGDPYLIKTDSWGNVLWKKAFEGSYYAQGYCVQQTLDGGYIIAGTWYIYGGTHDVLLLKTDAGGNLTWAKTFKQFGFNFGYSVQQTSDGGYIIVGETIDAFNSSNGDVYLLKTDSTGNLLWSKSYGGTHLERGYSIQQITDGGYVIAGITNSFGAGATDAYLLKTDSGGNLLWSKTFGGGTTYEDGYSFQQTSDGGYIITGENYSSSTGGNVYLIKTDSLGNSGCNESNPATVTSLPATIVTIPSILVSSGVVVATSTATITGSGGIENSMCLIVGMESPISNPPYSIIIFPNPATNELTIDSGELKIKEVEIYTVLGEKRLTPALSKGEGVSIDVSSLPAGIYFVKVKTEKEERVGKFFKQ